jgi:hypothetical protein
VKPVRGLLLTLAALVPTIGHAKAALPRYGTFVYSDLCWEKESGDAAGSRFRLSRTRKGARLDYEYGNGGLNSARIKSLRIEGNKLEAEAETGDGSLRFSATLDPKKAELSTHFEFEQGQAPEHQVLKRIKNFNQKIRVCRA